MQWWSYLIIVVGIIIVFAVTILILYLCFRRARDKVNVLLDSIIPLERERLDLILEVKQNFDEDGRFLPKNMVEETKKTEEMFSEMPIDLALCKGHLDYLTIYYCKYIEEKKLGEKNPKYNEYHDKMKAKLRLDAKEDKKDPYVIYNKAASKYNAYLSMTLLAILNLRSKNPEAPIL